MAIDVVEIRNGKANWKPNWKAIGKVGKRSGFEWGGNWKSFKDRPHFQMAHGKSISELQKLHSALPSGQTYVDLK